VCGAGGKFRRRFCFVRSDNEKKPELSFRLFCFSEMAFDFQVRAAGFFAA
jgi:hypothetical protein